MSDLGNKRIMARNIQFFMDKRDLSRQDMCQILSVPYTTFTDWINAKTYPRIDKIELMANYFGVSKSALVENHADVELDKGLPSNIRPITTRKIPMLGAIACGKPIYAAEDRDSYVEIDADLKADFCLRADGDSMVGASINDGDIVFIREQPIVDNGQIAAVAIGDEATLKRVYYYPDEGRMLLISENPRYEPLVYAGEQLNQIEILGKAMFLQRNII